MAAPAGLGRNHRFGRNAQLISPLQAREFPKFLRPSFGNFCRARVFYREDSDIIETRMLTFNRRLLPVILLLLAGSSLLAQDVPTFSSDVKVVNLLASVRDKHGQIVNNLTKDDFKLQQDGHPETIRYFSKVTDL